MRIKILLLGDDPVSLMAGGQLLRERGMLVYTAFNLENLPEIINEIKPDVVFFDPRQQTAEITAAYNDLVNSVYFEDVPVIYTLTEDDVYLVNRPRTNTGDKKNKEKKNIIADNMINAVRKALWSNKTHEKKVKNISLPNAPIPNFTVRA